MHRSRGLTAGGILSPCRALRQIGRGDPSREGTIVDVADWRFRSDLVVVRVAIFVVLALQVLLVNDLAPGPRWLAPTVEAVILLLLVVLELRGGLLLPGLRPGTHVADLSRGAWRMWSAVLIGVIATMNLATLVALVRALLESEAETGTTLLIDSLSVWTINVIAFAMAFWHVDGGGPMARSRGARSEFLFPEPVPDDASERFVPGFVDYLFVSFTTATSFSPADTAPLSHRMKLLMMAEASVSLLTIALVAARAVNILS
jgi:uncharacterized membrane protein